ncbi:XRE family transcriptional regulator [Vibrio sp. La 4.2.2]|uniref:LexA family protein n=1 Tax=Vibrio sp. La 4.2.2 TaxID=2998830 RepID=UPI0022CE33A4|nr:XRE family transcriptional regulator [Vibrio sp. La 4.2.2]MDA0107848.1 XRE family transcriptional regulator [Vibrio sp. La 4.2.2]
MNKNEEVGQRLKKLRLSRNMRQIELAKLCGWGASRISNYESGIRSISLQDAETIAWQLKVKPYEILFDSSELMELTDFANSNGTTEFHRTFPVLSALQANEWLEVKEASKDEFTEWHPTTESASKRAFWLRVRGESMTSPNGVSFPEDTLILVDPERQSVSGSFVVATLSGVKEVTFKKLVVDAGQKILMPLNTHYQPILIQDDNSRLVGTVIDAKLNLF